MNVWGDERRGDECRTIKWESVLRKGDRPVTWSSSLCSPRTPSSWACTCPTPSYFNLLQYFHTSVCLYVGPAPQVSAGGRVCGGKHSLKGSSLQGQSQEKATLIHASSFSEQNNREPLCSVFCTYCTALLRFIFSTAYIFCQSELLPQICPYSFHLSVTMRWVSWNPPCWS